MLPLVLVTESPLLRALRRVVFVCRAGLGCARPPGQLALCVLVCVFSVSSAASARADADVCINAHERAQVDRLEGRYLAARDKLLTCAQRECPRLVSTDCTTWLAALDATLPTVVFAVSDDSGRDLLEARVIVNGRLIANHVDGHALPLDPGVYTVRFEADGYAPDEQTLSIRDGEKSRLARGTLRPLGNGVSTRSAAARRDHNDGGAPGAGDSAPARGAPDLRARRLRIATYTLAGAAVATFAVTLASSLRGYHMEKVCNRGCSDSYAERGKLLYRTVNKSPYIGGAFLVAASATLLGELLLRPSSSESARLSLGAFADAHGAQLAAGGRW